MPTESVPGRRTLAGYRDRLSVRAGDTVRFMVSSFDARPFQADLVRIHSGNTVAPYAGLDLEFVAAPFAGEHAGVAQVVQCGSCGFVEDERPIVSAGGSFSLVCAVQPWTAARGASALIAFGDADTGGQLVLGADAQGRLTLRCLGPDGSELAAHHLSQPLPLRRWSVVGVSFDAGSRRLCLFQAGHARGPADSGPHEQETFDADLDLGALVRPTFGARWNLHEGGLETLEHLNGRLDAPRVVAAARAPEALAALVQRVAPEGGDAEVVGCWDFASDMGGDGFADRARYGLTGRFRNLPTRAVRGVRWTGNETCWRHAPDEYSAVHFHEYDVYDAGWEPSFAYTVPEELQSGVYAARLRKGEETDYVVFFVLPARAAPKAKVAFLASTATYLAYANELLVLPLGDLLGAKPRILPEEQLLVDHPEFGASLYQPHADGSGVHFSSYLRPTTNWRPGGRVWCLNADFDVIRWLRSTGEAFDVITDDALQREGEALLSDYRVVVTGTHPEYTSERMRESMEAFLEGGGRFMYLGGNGFYWKVAHSDAWPAAIELRRAEDGTRAWASEPAEYHHQFDGQLGGLWLRSAAPPQALVGVGFAAQGSPGRLRFRRQRGASDPRAAFLMAGVEGEVICDFHRMGATCNAEELDRADPSLGTPAHALVLASTENARADLLRTKEELLLLLPWVPDPDVRGDVVFFETRGGGAVFSTGSIGWASVLAHRRYENPAARLTANALARFLDPKPFVMPDATEDRAAMNPQVFDHPPGLRLGKLSWREILTGALGRVLSVLGLSAIAKWRGLPLVPPPPPRDRLDRKETAPRVKAEGVQR